MINDSATLIRFIQNSQMSEDMKERLMPLAQVANEKDRERIYNRVKDFNAQVIRIRKGTEPLNVDDIIFIRGLVEKFQEERQAKTTTKEADYLFDSHG